ncbi:MAG: hypothetical protein ACKPJD_28940, partial [Planctomycetaceae bacterium]
MPNCLFCAVCPFGEYINLSPDSSAVVAKADGWGVEIPHRPTFDGMLPNFNAPTVGFRNDSGRVWG